jgi:hypothetical protein
VLRHSLDRSLFDVDNLKKNWYPRIYSDKGKPTTIPPTNEWKDDHLLLFNIHYVRVENDDWKLYLCPAAALTPDASALSKYEFTPIQFSLGLYLLIILFLLHTI